jgi:nitroreductase
MNFSKSEYLSDLSQFRYATKKFDPNKKISQEDWQVLQESLRLSPSSYGLQPWKFIIITNDNLKKELRPVSWNQSQVQDCSHLVVFACLKKVTESYVDKFLNLTATTRSLEVSKLATYKEYILKDIVNGPRSKEVQHWAQKQAYIAFGNLMTTAAILHIDACPLEGIEPRKYDSIIGIENTEYETAAACALGFRHPEDKYAAVSKVRFKAEDVFDIRK